MIIENNSVIINKFSLQNTENKNIITKKIYDKQTFLSLFCFTFLKMNIKSKVVMPGRTNGNQANF